MIRPPRRAQAAFTLIELMIVVAIIALLASIAIPKFSELLKKANEGATKGSLGVLRSAISIYYGDNEGWYPSGPWNTNSSVLSDTLIPKYLDKIPTYNVGSDVHPPTTNVFCHWNIAPGDTHDGTGWIYDGYQPGDANWGTIWVACTHTDTKGSIWTQY